jgi:hypothetical protein
VYKDVQQRYPSFAIDADSWNVLCWFGNLGGQAQNVLDACEQAVKLASNNGEYHDSRGLARALTGDTAGAIEDFNAYIMWAQQKQFPDNEIIRRRDWIATLQSGRNPFDQATLEALRNE